MRRLIIAAFAVLVTAPAAGAQADALRLDAVDARTRAELVSARDAVWRAWFAGDSARLRTLIPPALAAGSGSNWETREATVASSLGFAAGHGRLLALRFDSTSIRLRGSVAVVQSRYSLVIEDAGERMTRTGIATEVFVRRDERWVNPFWYLESPP
ncbi:MAG: nuclear transport factor 2 family protein [Gemmatimonadales bacterium]